MAKHYLKTHPEYFAAVTNEDPTQRKTVELRLNDRNFQVGDVLILNEYDPANGMFTGKCCYRLITHVLGSGPWLTQGYVALSITPIQQEQP